MIKISQLNQNKILNHYSAAIINNNQDLIELVRRAGYDVTPHTLITEFAMWDRPLKEFLDRLSAGKEIS
jgi:hypothetical protein